MKHSITFLLLTFLSISFVGCTSARHTASEPINNKDAVGVANHPVTESLVTQQNADMESARSGASATQPNQTTPNSQSNQPSQEQTNNAQASNAAIERKIIRNAELVFEISAPDELQRKISSIAEAKGGYVISSDSTQQGGTERSPAYKLVKIIMRVPSSQFDATLNEIKTSGGGSAKDEKINGRDVTEEFIDMEARLRAMKATEAQMMEIMKRANSVNELLNVQQQVGQIRAQIESLEGRLRYLQNQTSFSTITITLQQPTPFITSPTGFFYRLTRSVGNGLDAAAEVTLFLIQAVLALLPIGVIIALPTFFLVRLIKRRNRKAVLAEQLAEETRVNR